VTGPALLAYDGSEDAAKAIVCAGRLLAQREALVVYSFVGLSRMMLRSNVDVVSTPLADVAKELDAADADEAERIAAEGAQLAIEAGLEARPIVVEQDGKPWQTLIACAKKHEAAAIVAGARGRSGLSSALLGSVSTGLVHHSGVPVLVTPADASVPGDLGTALLCYDASENARHAIVQASTLLGSREALVLNLWESWAARSPGYVPVVSGAVAGMARELDEIADGQSSELADEGVAYAEEVGLLAEPVSARCERGLWRGILDAADQHDVAAIVVGSRGLTGISSVLGSVSNGVVHHAKRPVLVVPPERA